MTALWTCAQALAATGGLCSVDFAATGVSIDTRTLQHGDLFVALKAERDGHDFVAAALAKGAAAALVAYRPADVAADAPLVIVEDVFSALQDLARAARARTAAKVLAITGSVGKTSAKEMARAALAAQGRTHAAEASYNNHWGVPLTLARMPRDTEFALIEIGMSAPGEIAPLAVMARPDVAVITTLAAAHLESFDSLDAIAIEKASITDGLDQRSGQVILNGDLPTSPILIGYAKNRGVDYTLFGQAEAHPWHLSAISATQDAQAVQASGPRGHFGFTLQAPGAHHAQNALGVLAACAALGADPQASRDGIATWQPFEGRGTRAALPHPKGGTFVLVDDAFNANPASMAASLEVFSLLDPGARHVAILGDMLELGPDEVNMHAGLGRLKATQLLAQIHTCGPRMAHLYNALPDHQRGTHVAHAAQLLPDLRNLIEPGDVVLVKGSKGSKVSLCVEALRDLTQPICAHEKR